MTTVRQRLRYRFDNLMARGIGAKILLLAAMAVTLIAIAVIAMIVTGAQPTDDKGNPDGTGILAWRSLTHTLDPGTLGNDTPGGNWPFLFVMLFVTIGGVFVVSSLIGVLASGFSETLDRLRRGRSSVIERGHTVILGWTPKIHTLLRELAAANAHHPDACVVVLADRDKVDMDTEIAASMHGKKLRVVTRTGQPMVLVDLVLASLTTCRAVIVLAPEHHDDGTPMAPHESDTIVLKTLLAIKKLAPDQELHVVAEIFDERTEEVARLVVGKKAGLIHASPLISRLLVQTGRQSGLSVVYQQLLDFETAELYFHAQPELAGKTFREAVFAYGTSSLVGICTADGEILLPPAMDRKMVATDEIIAITHDDASLVLDGAGSVDEAAIVATAPDHVHAPERTLVLGTSSRTATVARALDAHVAAGSVVELVGEDDELLPKAMGRAKLVTRTGDLTNRGLLDELDVTSFDHVIVLSETHERTQEMADARTTVVLLHLRDIERRAAKRVPITSEILDIGNRDLAAVAEADDFIVSNTLVSLLVGQLAQNPRLVDVFDELFGSGGHEIYLKPASQYVRAGEVTFATVCEAALRRDEIAIGYRLAAGARDADAQYGVVLDPAKRARVRLGAQDKVIVLAEA